MPCEYTDADRLQILVNNFEFTNEEAEALNAKWHQKMAELATLPPPVETVKATRKLPTNRHNGCPRCGRRKQLKRPHCHFCTKLLKPRKPPQERGRSAQWDKYPMCACGRSRVVHKTRKVCALCHFAEHALKRRKPPMRERILADLTEHGLSAVTELRERFPEVSLDSLYGYLGQLVKAGKLETFGKRKRRAWQIPSIKS